jgi:hypothetical protein
MIIKYSNTKLNSKTRVIFKCDNCQKIDDRNMKAHNMLINNNPDFNIDYCKACWNSIRRKTSRSREKMSNSIKKMIIENPEWITNNSNSKKNKINLGDSNGMKKIESRKKASESRKKIMTPDFKQKISEYTSKAWKDGKFDNVKVGMCKWFEYSHSNGIEYKVQGTWELEFIKWLDVNNISFVCHRDRIPYILEGKNKMYYPDFYIHSWNCYVDIKNEYHYNLQKNKFEALKEQGINIKIILKDELEKLINKKL